MKPLDHTTKKRSLIAKSEAEPLMLHDVEHSKLPLPISEQPSLASDTRVLSSQSSHKLCNIIAHLLLYNNIILCSRQTQFAQYARLQQRSHPHHMRLRQTIIRLDTPSPQIIQETPSPMQQLQIQTNALLKIPRSGSRPSRHGLPLRLSPHPRRCNNLPPSRPTLPPPTKPNWA